MTLTVGSLFSGIGGFDLGLERAGMKVIWQSEIDEFASKVLKKHWPDVPNLGDITKVDWTNIERPDVICGGYPCQPFSTAGKRGGANDPRHLWPAMHNAICVLRPRYALMENVRGHLSLGFGRVLGDLAEIGYDAEWQVIPAAAVGAPHKRDRVFIVAYPNDERQSSRIKKTKPKFNGRSFNEATSQPTSPNNTRFQTDAAMADTKGKQSNGRQRQTVQRNLEKKGYNSKLEQAVQMWPTPMAQGAGGSGHYNMVEKMYSQNQIS
jgi:DNA-cytosine methyltransferase